MYAISIETISKKNNAGEHKFNIVEYIYYIITKKQEKKKIGTKRYKPTLFSKVTNEESNNR